MVNLVASPSQESRSSSPASTRSIEVHEATSDIYSSDEPPGLDRVYYAKARLLNNAVQEIGMGKYQWWLFVVTGFGWLTDNLLPVVIGLILGPVVNEFSFQAPFLKLAQSIGLLIGAVFWGVGSDIWGRKWCFNITLLIVGIFATAAGASPNYIVLCSLTAVWSIGVGGNMPVDSAIFLEFVPPSHQYLLTILSAWWTFGQLLGCLIAWPLISNFSCPHPKVECPRSENQGWRYLLYTVGGFMFFLWVIRFFLFNLYESPKYLMGRGRDAEAIKVLEKVAIYNGSTNRLTFEQLREIGVIAGAETEVEGGGVVDGSATAAIRRNLKHLKGEHVRSLFATRKLALSTSLLIVLWAFIGLAFPLYNAFITYFLQIRGIEFGDGSVYTTYRNRVILAVIGVPGALLAGWMVELPLLGRKGTLAIATVLTGFFLFASTTAGSSNAYLGWNCGYSFTSSIMYGVLYAISPELFPTKDRGTGNAIVAGANRIFGVMAPIIALEVDLKTSVPIYISAVLFTASGFIALLLPFEPRGKASL